MSQRSPVLEYEFEASPGLPEHLPEGEELLWQGAPSAWLLARRTFHTWKVAVYFGLLLVWRLAEALQGGATLAQAAGSASVLVILAIVALGLLGALAWLTSRTTLYTITSERVVMRVGIALELAVNLPFREVEEAGLRSYRDGSGDISLRVQDADRIGYLMLWPHARPWRFGRKLEPSLRALPEVREVAQLLSRALAASADAPPVALQAPASAARRPAAVAAVAS